MAVKRRCNKCQGRGFEIYPATAGEVQELVSGIFDRVHEELFPKKTSWNEVVRRWVSESLRALGRLVEVGVVEEFELQWRKGSRLIWKVEVSGTVEGEIKDESESK